MYEVYVWGHDLHIFRFLIGAWQCLRKLVRFSTFLKDMQNIQISMFVAFYKVVVFIFWKLDNPFKIVFLTSRKIANTLSLNVTCDQISSKKNPLKVCKFIHLVGIGQGYLMMLNWNILRGKFATSSNNIKLKFFELPFGVIKQSLLLLREVMLSVRLRVVYTLTSLNVNW